jgi:hypothetical protein
MRWNYIPKRKRVISLDFAFAKRMKVLENIEKRAIDAAKHGFTSKDSLRRAFMVINQEEIDEVDKYAIFSLIVNYVLTPEGRKRILDEGHKKEVQEYFKRELGIAWQPGYLHIKEDDGSVETIKLMRFYLADEKPSFLRCQD